MLEPLVDAWEEEPSSDIKMHLLTAAVKLFFKRPPEMQVCEGQTSSLSSPPPCANFVRRYHTVVVFVFCSSHCVISTSVVGRRHVACLCMMKTRERVRLFPLVESRA